MNIILKAIIIGFSLLPMHVHASTNTYYVTQAGAGNRDGTAIGDAWSVAEFNALTGTGYAGDTFFFSGTITSEITVGINGTSGSYVTLDGYETDNTTYMNLSEAAGRALIDRTAASGIYGMELPGKDYIIIQDFEIVDCHIGIYITDDSSWVTAKRNYIYECTRNGIYSGDASLAQDNITIGGSSGHGNVIKNVGIDTSSADIVMCQSHDVIISYNHLYADSASWGIDGIVPTCLTCYDILIEYNSIHGHSKSEGAGTLGEDGIDLKDGAYNVIIRYNHIYDNDNGSYSAGGHGININSALGDIYIYGNRFSGNRATCIYADQDHDDIYFFSNICRTVAHGCGVVYTGSDSEATDWWIFNNTFAENATDPNSSAYSHLYISANDGMVIKNNIMYKGRPNESDYRQLYISTGADDNVTLYYNRYYWPSQTSEMFHGDAGSTNLTGLQGGSTNGLPQETHGSEGDPGLTDINNHDYTIAPGAAVIGTGVDMGSGAIANVTIQGVVYPVYWDVALGPNTDWSGTIPVVEVLRRDIVGWDVGAYGYLAEPVKPLAPMSPPPNVRVSGAK